MERTANIDQSRSNETFIAIAIILLFHAVGLIGFFTPSLKPLFLLMVPYHLLLMMLVILLTHRRTHTRFIVFALLVWVVAFVAEWIGIHRSWLFGHYIYGSTLGVKINGVPLIIGINWLLLIYSTGVLMRQSRLKNTGARILAGALLLVLLDRLIEPVAMRFNYWMWADNHVPVKNYICWFILSSFLLFVFEKFNFKNQGIVAPVLLLTQFLFFGSLVFGSRWL